MLTDNKRIIYYPDIREHPYCLLVIFHPRLVNECCYTCDSWTLANNCETKAL